MSGHRPFSDLMKDWSPERRAHSEASKIKLTNRWASFERLCHGMGIGSEEMARLIDLEQSAISRLLRSPDMKVSTLRELSAAMGGEMHITATFSDRSVEIGGLAAADHQPDAAVCFNPL